MSLTQRDSSRQATFTLAATRIGAAMLAAPRSASAECLATVDQQNTVAVDSFIASNVSQSFTPTLTGVDAIELWLGTPENSTQVRVDQYEGDGTGGTLLGSTESLTLTGFGLTHFDFASTVALTAGNVYTFQLVQLAGDAVITQATGDTYAGGTARDANGNPAFYGDIFFKEGLHATSAVVPEPTSLALFGLGLAGLGIGYRRCRRNPAPAV